MRAIFAVLLLLLLSPAAAAQGTGDEEAAIRTVIAAWYAELQKKDGGRISALTAPGFIDASPHYRYIDTGAAMLGPRVYTSLPARALKFAYDIERLRIDPNFAKVNVWERGYFYAFAAQKTYESAAGTLFILERQEKDSRWLILAHQSSSLGIPPNKITDPMPDLRDHFYATEGKERDPEADARNAGKF
ncbi:hypothetical protein [Hyphomicrobium sp.]|uniref:hypothetical protein n=1 Tax=Hyphomicrobium sp. TaxID=82 RepID=UPI0025BFB00C|nr:hypothetical protein [Hyphomicrobium sp.]MCC7252501.1 hypothetical protein [Hyphomicrobium sp.]